MQTLSQADNAEQTISLKMLKAMVGIGIVCACLIALTFELTLPRIENLKAEALNKAISIVIPGMATKKIFGVDINNNLVEVNDKGKSPHWLYAGYDENGKLTGLAVEASGIGFGGVLRILYGYDPEKQAITGFHVLESKETPGLGDKIEKSPDFLENFRALDVSLNEDNVTLKHKITAVKNGTKKNPWEIDGITGATISSRAIGTILADSTRQMMPLINRHKSMLEKNKP